MKIKELLKSLLSREKLEVGDVVRVKFMIGVGEYVSLVNTIKLSYSFEKYIGKLGLVDEVNGDDVFVLLKGSKRLRFNVWELEKCEK